LEKETGSLKYSLSYQLIKMRKDGIEVFFFLSLLNLIFLFGLFFNLLFEFITFFLFVLFQSLIFLWSYHIYKLGNIITTIEIEGPLIRKYQNKILKWVINNQDVLKIIYRYSDYVNEWGGCKTWIIDIIRNESKKLRFIFLVEIGIQSINDFIKTLKKYCKIYNIEFIEDFWNKHLKREVKPPI